MATSLCEKVLGMLGQHGQPEVTADMENAVADVDAAEQFIPISRDGEGEASERGEEGSLSVIGTADEAATTTAPAADASDPPISSNAGHADDEADPPTEVVTAEQVVPQNGGVARGSDSSAALVAVPAPAVPPNLKAKSHGRPAGHHDLASAPVDKSSSTAALPPVAVTVAVNAGCRSGSAVAMAAAAAPPIDGLPPAGESWMALFRRLAGEPSMVGESPASVRDGTGWIHTSSRVVLKPSSAIPANQLAQSIPAASHGLPRKSAAITWRTFAAGDATAGGPTALLPPPQSVDAPAFHTSTFDTVAAIGGETALRGTANDLAAYQEGSREIHGLHGKASLTSHHSDLKRPRFNLVGSHPPQLPGVHSAMRSVPEPRHVDTHPCSVPVMSVSRGAHGVSALLSETYQSATFSHAVHSPSPSPGYSPCADQAGDAGRAWGLESGHSGNAAGDGAAVDGACCAGKSQTCLAASGMQMAVPSMSEAGLILSSVEQTDVWQPQSVMEFQGPPFDPQQAPYPHHQAGRMRSEDEMELEMAVWRSRLLSSAFQEEVACIESLLAQGAL